MGEPATVLFGQRVWFRDARTVVRRMGVSTHPDLGLIILSLWQGDVCTGTFRLPITEAPELIATLADALLDSAATGS